MILNDLLFKHQFYEVEQKYYRKKTKWHKLLNVAVCCSGEAVLWGRGPDRAVLSAVQGHFLFPASCLVRPERALQVPWV